MEISTFCSTVLVPVFRGENGQLQGASIGSLAPLSYTSHSKIKRKESLLDSEPITSRKTGQESRDLSECC